MVCGEWESVEVWMRTMRSFFLRNFRWKYNKDTQVAVAKNSVPYYKVNKERLCLKELNEGEETTPSGK